MFKPKRAAQVWILTAMIIILGISSAYSQSEDETLRNGASLIHHDKLDEAISEFNKVIATDPKSASAYYNLGFAYDKKGDLTTAIMDFTKAIEIDPALTDAYYNRGFAYYKKGDFDKAIVDYNKVIEISPDAADAYYGLGLVYSQKGDLDKAISSYGKAIDARPNFPLAYDARAVAYVTKKNYLAALADVNKAQALGFRSRPVRRMMGRSLTATEKQPVAASDKATSTSRSAIPLTVAGFIFLIMSVMQLMRVIAKAKVVINDKIVIPLWMSMIASPALLLLAVYMFIAARQ